MLPSLFGFLIIIFMLFLLYVLTYARRDKRYHLLCSLGLSNGLPYGFRPPFYKWGWRKHSKDRVWGERIVREAFETVNIGLSSDDLDYFEKVCEAFASKKKVEHKEIVDRVKAIYARSSSVYDIADDSIHPLLNDALNTAPARALSILQDMGIQTTADAAPFRLAVTNFTRMLTRVGSIILQPESSGFEIKSKGGERIMLLVGFDGWEHWLKACRGSVERYMRLHAISSRRQILKKLKAQLTQGVLLNYLNDLQESRRFLNEMCSTSRMQDSGLNREEIERMERLCYYWQLADKERFDIRTHKNLRNFFMRQDLAPRFQELVAKSIGPYLESVAGLVKKFSRNMIFYGDNHDATSYATEEYYLYMQQLSKLIFEMLGQPIKPPLLLKITEGEIERARRGEFVESLESINKVDNDTEESAIPHGHIPQLIEVLKSIILFEKSMDLATAKQWGWIIEMQTADFTPQEWAQLDMSEYLYYKRVNCDALGNFSTEGSSASHKKQRLQFMNQVVDKLIQGPTASRSKPVNSDK